MPTSTLEKKTETFTASLALSPALTGYATVTSVTATCMFLDDAAATVIYALSLHDALPILVFSVSLSNPIDTTAVVNVSFTDGSATGGGTDYTSTTQAEIGRAHVRTPDTQ